MKHRQSSSQTQQSAVALPFHPNAQFHAFLSNDMKQILGLYFTQMEMLGGRIAEKQILIKAGSQQWSGPARQFYTNLGNSEK